MSDVHEKAAKQVIDALGLDDSFAAEFDHLPTHFDPEEKPRSAKMLPGLREIVRDAIDAFEFDPDQPRDEGGRWTSGGGGGDDTEGKPGREGALGEVFGGEAVRVGDETIALKGTPEGKGTPDDPIYVDGDFSKAVEAMAEGKSVRLDDEKQASILVERLRDTATALKEQGEKAPDFNLCDVSAGDTNVFCENSMGIPRVEMPQTVGKAVDGSEAAKLRKDPNDSDEYVSGEAAYRDALKASGVEIVEKTVPASMLRPSQGELNGGKVGGIMGDIQKHGVDPEQAIYISKDGYVLDGHHRWAAVLAADLADGHKGDIAMPVHEVQMEVGAALDFTNAFTRDFGIASAGLGAGSAPKGLKS